MVACNNLLARDSNKMREKREPTLVLTFLFGTTINSIKICVLSHILLTNQLITTLINEGKKEKKIKERQT
jgi:hypothetical protein